jgi:hypothetical protein
MRFLFFDYDSRKKRKVMFGNGVHFCVVGSLYSTALDEMLAGKAFVQTGSGDEHSGGILL